jgi:hypothetical protein
MSLPRIELLSCEFNQDVKFSSVDMSSSSLRHLSLSGWAPDETVQQLLALPRDLVSFDSHTPVSKEYCHGPGLSPAAVSLALRPAYKTLTRLTLTGLDDLWVETDGSLVDLTPLEALRALEIVNVYCLPLGVNDTSVSRRNLWNRFPANLEALEVGTKESMASH